MPVSHVGLTVSHLPTSCSFYLAALQPLGYRYIGQQDNQIGFGLDEADFFICQDSSGTKPAPTHIAFLAKSREEVDSFFEIALKAGGSIHAEPKERDSETGYYSATVIDLDNNSIEALHCGDCGKTMSTISESPRSHVTEYTTGSNYSALDRSPLRPIVNNITTTITTTTRNNPSERTQPEKSDNKALLGTLIGAAAGAAIAYAFAKTDNSDSSSQQPNGVHRTVIRQTIRARSPSRSRYNAPVYRQDSSTCVTAATSRQNNHVYEIEAPPSTVSDNPSTKPHRSSRPRQIEAPSSEVSRAHSRTSRRTLKPLAIEAPPSMASHATSAKSRRSHPPPPSFHTVLEPTEVYGPASVIEPSPSHVTHASHARPATRIGSEASASTIRDRNPQRVQTADYPIISSRRTSTYTTDLRDIDLPASRRTSVYTTKPYDVALPASRQNSTYTTDPRDIELPASRKSSAYTTQPHDITPPVSRRTSTYTYDAQNITLPASRRTSTYTTQPHEVALPASAHSSHRHSTSHRSMGPPVARSATFPSPHDDPVAQTTKTHVSSGSVSTVRPLTRGNIRRAMTDNGIDDDVDTVVPEDSISQAGHKERSGNGEGKHRRRRSSAAGGKSGKDRRRELMGASSRVSMPRSLGRAFGL